MEKSEKLIFTSEDGEEIEFYILEETKLNGKNFLLVADDIEGEEATEAIYEVVEDEEQLTALSKVFTELMDDLDIELE